MCAYSGELEVEDGDFVLDADRLIVRGGEVAFTHSGSDESHRYTQIDVLPSFRHGVPESRGQGGPSRSSSSCPRFRHSPACPTGASSGAMTSRL